MSTPQHKLPQVKIVQVEDHQPDHLLGAIIHPGKPVVDALRMGKARISPVFVEQEGYKSELVSLEIISPPVAPANPAAEFFDPVDPAKWFSPLKYTPRGFPFVSFKDSDGDECTVRQSSLALCPLPGRSALCIQGHGPSMSLTLPQVVAFIGLLQSWVDTGELAVPTARPSDSREQEDDDITW